MNRALFPWCGVFNLKINPCFLGLTRMYSTCGALPPLPPTSRVRGRDQSRANPHPQSGTRAGENAARSRFACPSCRPEPGIPRPLLGARFGAAEAHRRLSPRRPERVGSGPASSPAPAPFPAVPPLPSAPQNFPKRPSPDAGGPWGHPRGRTGGTPREMQGGTAQSPGRGETRRGKGWQPPGGTHRSAALAGRSGAAPPRRTAARRGAPRRHRHRRHPLPGAGATAGRGRSPSSAPASVHAGLRGCGARAATPGCPRPPPVVPG